MHLVPNRLATAQPKSARGTLTSVLITVVCAGILMGCDPFPEGGYDKVTHRVREPVMAITDPAPPPVVAGIGAGGTAEVPTLPAGAPADVTQDMVASGAQLFGTICAACHGPGGAGTVAAPTLADATWINIAGTYDQIVSTIHTGVPQPKEHPGLMPPLGGGNFDDNQVRDLAAYVYALSHQGT